MNRVDQTEARRSRSERLFSTPIRRRTLLAGCAALSCAGCKEETATDAVLEMSRRGLVAFVSAGPHDPLWPVLKAGALRQMRFGSRVRVQFYTPADDSPRAQADLLASKLGNPDIRGVCIHINNQQAVAPLLAKLYQRGLVIVSMVEAAPEATRFAHVGLDDIEIGRKLARCTAEALGPRGGTIMVLHAGDKYPIYGMRHIIFMEEIRRHSSVEVLADLDCNDDPQKAVRIVRERSQRYPRLNAWVAMHDWLSDAHAQFDDIFGPQTRYITFGGLPCQWALVSSGRCTCLLGADYGEIGSQALQLCSSGVHEPTQDKRLAFVPLRPLSSDNIDAYIGDWTGWTMTPGQSQPQQATSQTAGD